MMTLIEYNLGALRNPSPVDGVAGKFDCEVEPQRKPFNSCARRRLSVPAPRNIGFVDYGLAVDPFVEWNEIHRPIAVELARVRAADAHVLGR
jgi:hypothetical protein